MNARRVWPHFVTVIWLAGHIDPAFADCIGGVAGADPCHGALPNFCFGCVAAIAMSV